jgi:hypothetical protein
MYIKIILLIAFLAHVLCGYNDCLLSYGAKGRLDFKDIRYPETNGIFNTLIFMLVLSPTKGNIAGAAMYLGLLIVLRVCSYSTQNR